MIVDGKAIQVALKEKLRKEMGKYGKRLELLLIYAGENPVIDKYIELKQAFGEYIGINVNVERFPADISNDRLQEAVHILTREESHGMIVQLPLPPQVEVQPTLDLIPLSKDADVLSEEAFKKFVEGRGVLPPVVGSIEEICTVHGINFEGKHIVVVGKGRLVGKPVALWLLQKGIQVTILERGDDITAHVQSADIVISGAGSPGLITPDIIKEGAVLIDAGTADENGKLSGDIDHACASKASLFAPVPGGIGPITVAKLFENFLRLNRVID